MISVCCYCRVSTDKDDQANSFEAQQRYFRELIQSHSDWNLFQVYADEGITGTSTNRRAAFQQMIEDAEAGRFRLILTKEVSRFSRNILDTISYTRQLKSLGVAVLFVTDGINTMDPDAELRLSIMATMAQEESRRTSGRVTWGQTRQMERGIVFGRSLLGYDVRNGALIVNEYGAEIVRRIFEQYALEGLGTTAIAGQLRRAGVQTVRGNRNWTAHSIVRILKNEKYVGDLIQKKTYTPDYLTHQKKQNRGEIPQIILKNHHTPIISRELWDLTQAKLQSNNKHTDAGVYSGPSPLSGKIRCRNCGKAFISRTKYRKDGSSYKRWCCHSSCGIGKILREDDALQMFSAALQQLPVNRQETANHIAARFRTTYLSDQQSAAVIQRSIAQISAKKEALLDHFLTGTISKEELQVMKLRYERELFVLREQLQRPRSSVHARQIEQTVSALLDDKIESDLLCRMLLEEITVYPDRRMALRLKQHPQIFWFSG